MTTDLRARLLVWIERSGATFNAFAGVDIEDALELAKPEEIESPPAQAGVAAIDSNEA